MKAWINGQLVESDQARVSAFDHGLTVGDGVFETLKVLDGVPFALTRHLERLARSSAALGLPAVDLELVRSAAAELIEVSAAEIDQHEVIRLRITITGGPGPLGSMRGTAEPTLILALAPSAPWPPSAAVALVTWRRNERSAIVGVKTTSYAENVVALAHAKSRGASEALFLNTKGELCEGTGSNVFIERDGQLVTPPLSSGCLAGVTRQLVLEWCGADEQVITESDLISATEVALTSSTRDIHPVRAVDGRPLVAPGPATARAMTAFAARMKEDLDP